MYFFRCLLLPSGGKRDSYASDTTHDQTTFHTEEHIPLPIARPIRVRRLYGLLLLPGGTRRPGTDLISFCVLTTTPGMIERRAMILSESKDLLAEGHNSRTNGVADKRSAME